MGIGIHVMSEVTNPGDDAAANGFYVVEALVGATQGWSQLEDIEPASIRDLGETKAYGEAMEAATEAINRPGVKAVRVRLTCDKFVVWKN